MNKKKIYTYVGIAIVGVMMAAPTYAMRGQGIGNGNGQKGAQNMIDENGNGIPDGLDDFDGDGIINRDDDDYEKQYLNMQDADDDGVANRIDEDYEPAENGANRPETAGQKQMIQNREQLQNQDVDDMASEVQARVTNRNQNRVANQNDGMLAEKVRAMVQEQERLQENITDDIRVLQKQSGFKRVFMGADRDSVESAEDQLARYDERTRQLKVLSESTTDLEDKAFIDEQIELMESASSRLQKQIEDSSGGFSLFGWVLNLFN